MEKNRIQKYYSSVVVEDLLILYNCKNIMQLPCMSRVILNTSSKDFVLDKDKQEMLNAFAACSLLAGQKGAVTRARKSIASFQLRKGSMIGCMVTIRRSKMYAFFDKVITCVFPRLRAQAPHASLGAHTSNKSSNATQEQERFNLDTAALTNRKEEQLQILKRRKDPDYQFGVKEATFFPEIENLLEVLSVQQGSLLLAKQGFHITLSLSIPRSAHSRPRREEKVWVELCVKEEVDSSQSFASKKQAFLLKKINTQMEKQKDLVFLSALQHPGSPE